MTDDKKPVVYENTIKVRFGDLDPYGHVNAPVYLDYINSSRANYLVSHLGTSSAKLAERGLGFFMANSNINYRRSPSQTAEVTVKSWVSDYSGSKLTVDFTIEEGDMRVVDGQLLFLIIDLTTMKPQPLPEWAEFLAWG